MSYRLITWPNAPCIGFDLFRKTDRWYRLASNIDGIWKREVEPVYVREGWLTTMNLLNDGSSPRGDAIDLTKEEAAMILFEAEDPRWRVS